MTEKTEKPEEKPQPEKKPAKEPTYRLVAEGAQFGLTLGGKR